MIRITGGRFRGRQIDCPKGKAVRPTTAFVRESLFSILGPRIVDARFLDLFAGCGIVGFEALSRGAVFVLAVEQHGGHSKMLEKNRELLGLSPEDYRIITMDVFAWLKKQQPEATGFDVIYLDPPYALGEEAGKVVEACLHSGILAPTGILIWENSLRGLPDLTGAIHQETRRYGESALSFFTHPARPESQTG